MQVLYEYIFCSGVFGIFTSYPRQLLQVVGSKKIGDVEGVLAVEEDENFLKLSESYGVFERWGEAWAIPGGGSRTRSKVPHTEH